MNVAPRRDVAYRHLWRRAASRAGELTEVLNGLLDGQNLKRSKRAA